MIKHAYSPLALDHKLAEGLLDVHSTMLRRKNIRPYADDKMISIAKQLRRYIRNFKREDRSDADCDSK